MDVLRAMVKSGTFSPDATMKSENSGNIRLDIILCDDNIFAGVQFFLFVPYTYNPVTSVQYFTNGEAASVAAFLAKSKIR